MNEPSLDLTAFRNAIASLEGGLELVGNSVWFNQQPSIVQDMLIAGVIQHFEFVYELSIKMIRRQIELESDSPDQIDRTNFWDMLRIAGEKGIIAGVEAWFAYHKTRDISAHTYDREIAQQVYKDTQKFIGGARSLLAGLEARNG